MKIRDLVVLSLACWRLSNMLVNEEGPGNIFVTLRRKAGIYYDSFSQKQTSGWVADLFDCVWCMSVWVGFVLAFLHQWRVFRRACIAPLAISSLSILLHERLVKDNP